MSYIKSSTNNPLGPLGFKPWNAMLQKGGLGAFFPNAEAIGPNSVLLDRDSGNAGWKSWGAGNAIVPRKYYPPNFHKQFTTPRGQALGIIPVPVSVNEGSNAPQICPAWGCGGPFRFSRAYVGADTSPIQSNTNNAPGTYSAPILPFSVSPAAGVSYQATAGTPVPPSWPVTQDYTDPAGNVWQFNGSQWVIVSVTVTGPTGTVGVPVSSADATLTGSASASSWLTDNTLISAVPNWVTLGGGVLGAFLLVSMLGRKR